MILTGSAFDQFLEGLKTDEGFRQYVYQDTTGHMTCGFGHNLTANGISKSIAEAMLLEDVSVCEEELIKSYPTYLKLDDTRKSVLLALSYNLGIIGLMNFRKMLNAIENSDFKMAASELLDSEAARLLHNRYQKYAFLLES